MAYEAIVRAGTFRAFKKEKAYYFDHDFIPKCALNRLNLLKDESQYPAARCLKNDNKNMYGRIVS